MEYNWERTLPFFSIDLNIANKLFKKTLLSERVESIKPINEGCRSSNYIIKTNKNNKYMLKIFPEYDYHYEREKNLLSILKNDISVQNIYIICNSNIINNRTFGIYEYIDGKTLSQALRNGYCINEKLVREVAKSLAFIHNYKFNELGDLDCNLNTKKVFSPTYRWYELFINDNCYKRLGKDIIEKILNIAKDYKDVLVDLDKDISLVHGDFQGTNILINNDSLVGIIDWEFTMAGHAIADIGQFFRYYKYFNKNLLDIFEKEYNNYSTVKLTKDWYKISKLRDMINLLQLIGKDGEMPNKFDEIKQLIIESLKIL
ncbi:aminoglycoside phosphotransferase family protein [Clostridium taeniosporum]|uniref:Aminoglycoside phosphotransferase n=1 Tax=Clostridium taeniosporum TaxID=394958 RepID=A0A1D7XN88_9CLOT|nr:aminoglycoside phosphotransferase family protein [Clostridium taeniosporum]AOR24798.1 aminoglycoside phosphotransferase [Clostridium taeniosporum]